MPWDWVEGWDLLCPTGLYFEKWKTIHNSSATNIVYISKYIFDLKTLNCSVALCKYWKIHKGWGSNFFKATWRKTHLNGFLNMKYECVSMKEKLLKSTVGKPHFSAGCLSHGSVQTEQLFSQFVWVLTLGNETLWLNINYSAQIEGKKWDNLDLRNHCTNQIYIWWLLVCHLRGGDVDDDGLMYRSSLTSPIKESFLSIVQMLSESVLNELSCLTPVIIMCSQALWSQGSFLLMSWSLTEPSDLICRLSIQSQHMWLSIWRRELLRKGLYLMKWD